MLVAPAPEPPPLETPGAHRRHRWSALTGKTCYLIAVLLIAAAPLISALRAGLRPVALRNAPSGAVAALPIFLRDHPSGKKSEHFLSEQDRK